MKQHRYIYGLEWNTKLRKMRDSIDESEARKRFHTGPWFSIAKFEHDDQVIPTFSIELQANAKVARVVFYDSAGSVVKIHDFTFVNDQLFLDNTVKYTYSAKGFHRMNETATVVTINYTPEGIGHITTDDVSRPDIERTSYENVDVSSNWEPVPKFGEWESLGRRDRT